MQLICKLKGGDTSLKKDFNIAFGRETTTSYILTTSSISIEVSHSLNWKTPDAKRNSYKLKDAIKSTLILQTATTTSRTVQRQQNGPSSLFFDDPANIAMVSSIFCVGVPVVCTVLIYCLKTRTCKRMATVAG